MNLGFIFYVATSVKYAIIEKADVEPELECL